MKTVINMDNALEIYYDIKDEENACWVFDKSKKKFVEANSDCNNENYVLFIDCFKTANEVIDIYLAQDGMEHHKKSFEKFKQTGNRVTDILWYFEHIDGAYPFEDFECIYVSKIIEEWCIKIILTVQKLNT